MELTHETEHLNMAQEDVHESSHDQDSVNLKSLNFNLTNWMQWMAVVFDNHSCGVDMAASTRNSKCFHV